MEIALFIGQFLVGLLVIVKGADWMTDGAADIAKRFGISTLVIGMTIVAIGSSAPEFVVSALAAIKGSTEMAIGNVVGSNIFNILAIMGATALVAPVAASRGNLRYDVPFAVLSSLVVFVAAFDSFFQKGAVNEISRSEGLLMLCLFAVFISYSMAIARKNEDEKDPLPTSPSMGRSCKSGRYDNENENEDETLRYENDNENENENNENGDKGKGQSPLYKSIGLVIVGLGLLIFGGDWLVEGASGVAKFMGVSESIIALTIVSMGTSAPELAASMMAAKKGDTAMALGNVVGSVVFNVFFVLGTAAAIHPLALGNINIIDIATLLIASVLLWIFCKSHHSLIKWEGIVLIVLQIAYYAILVYNEQ